MKRLGDVLSPGNFPQKPSDGSGEERPRAGVPAEVCPICKGKGFLTYDVPPGHPNFSKVMPCSCTEARLALQRSSAMLAVSNLGQLSRMNFEEFLPGGIGLPDAVRATLIGAFELCQEFADEPSGWLVLLGGYGCGKTHLAAAIANHRIAHGHPAMFVVVPDLLDHLRATYAPSSPVTYDERLEAIRETPLLILDDFGAHNSTPWAQEKLYQILNYRYNGRLPTVVTSNQRLEELDPRISSRLVDPDLSRVWQILAPDFRNSGADRGSGSSSLNSLEMHADQSFESFSLRKGEVSPAEHENLQRAASVARAFAEDPRGWLVFTGTFGCGKTHLAAAIANHQKTFGRPTPLLVVVPDLLDHLRATFSPSSTTTLDKVFEQVRSASLLVLDDLGTESATPWAREKLFQLLNYRYAARLPTVITTVNAIDQIEPRLQSRMLDSSRCRVFAIEAPGFHKSERQQAKNRTTRRLRDQ